jgi:excinuclease ABC subunit C
VKSTNFDKLREQSKNLPTVPGVYIYRDDTSEVIYVGKAKNLKNRVGSYFQLNLDPTSKTYALVQNIKSLDYIEVSSEFDALILEAELIRKYRPKYNIDLKDDKSYLYIVIRNEEFVINGAPIKIPKILTARRSTIAQKDIVFGPYPDGQAPKYIIKALRKVIPFRDCNPSKYATYHKAGHPCLFGHIGLCSAPCVNFDAQSMVGYKKYISQVKKVLSGGGNKYVADLTTQMNRASKAGDFETAAKCRDLISKFNYVRQNFRPASDYMENPYLMSDLATQSMETLQSHLPMLKTPPKRIECYDIANISGKEAVGSMVVAVDGKIDKREYRKFRIKLKAEPDDFGMMREVLERRLKHADWGVPDLLVVDGGKGQVSAAVTAMEKVGVRVPLIGLAKKFETIIYKDIESFVELRLPKTDKGLSLLIRLRDEAHRFAQSYHHKLRLKQIRQA